MSRADAAGMRRHKPGYSLSRRMIWANALAGWAVVFAVVGFALWGEAQATAIAPVVIPSMLALIAALLGIHRFAGALDMRSAADFSRGGSDAGVDEPERDEEDASDKRRERSDD